MNAFWKKVHKTDTCWLWRAYTDEAGYGITSFRKRLHKAHRVSWMLSCGEIPAGKKVLHRCDVRNCVRPDHLFLGTQADNVADMIAKGRNRSIPRPGERNPMARLTEQKVLAMRSDAAAGINQHQLAKLYGVSVMTVNRAVRRISWSHI